MRITTLLAAIALSWLANPPSAHAGSIQVTRSKRVLLPPVAAVALPISEIHSLFATTDGDILSVNNVQITLDSGVQLYNVAPPFGSNVEPPDPLFIQINRTLEADSWITTPGATSLLGPDFPGDGTSTWGDLTDDGPQTNFHFANLTLPPGTLGRFNFRISIADPSAADGVFSRSFQITVPEPAAGALAVVGLIAVGVGRRRSAALVDRIAPCPAVGRARRLPNSDVMPKE